jgi:segregation and condensation protein B
MASAVGAVIFASDEPVQPKEIARALGKVEIADVRKAIRAIEEHYEQHDVGLRLEWIAGGVRLATRPEVGEWVRQFFRQRNQTRLSPAALETLAIIAYRQPATAPEIQAIRGKDPSAALKGLLDKKLVKCLGRKKVVGNPLLYGTSRTFLEHFGLNNLGDLPSIEDFDQFLDVLDVLPVEEEIETEGDASPADEAALEIETEVEVAADTTEADADRTEDDAEGEQDAPAAETLPDVAETVAATDPSKTEVRGDA